VGIRGARLFDRIALSSRRRGGGRLAWAAGLLLTTLAPPAVVGQEGLLERWTLGSVAGSWAPRWSDAVGLRAGGAGDATRVVFRASAETARFAASLRHHASTFAAAASHPFSDRLAARLGVVSGSSSSYAGGRDLLETARSEAIAAGLVLTQPIGSLARARLDALVGRDEGWGGEARLTLESRWQSLTASLWHSNARPSRVLLPADSLGDIAVDQRARGWRVDATARAFPARLTVEARGDWSRDHLDERTGSADAFFVTSPTGRSESYGVALAVNGPLGTVEAGHRWQSLHLESVVTRGGVSAGRLFFAESDARRWSGAIRSARSSGRWAVVGGAELLTGRLSTRIETWPFASIWEQLAVQAYRLQADLDGRAAWLGARRDPVGPTGWSVGLHVARFVVRADRRSWYVTGFGFGRTDEVSSTKNVDPAWLVGGSLGRVFAIGPATASIHADAGLPVYAGTGSETAGPPSTSAGLSGYATIETAVAW
jgi:hypothetical protein